MDFSINNVINISVLSPGAGLSEANTSNIALFTTEQPETPYDSGYKIFRDPSLVAEDFGSASIVSRMAVAGYSQQPNIQANRGYLTIIPMLTQQLSVDFSPSPVSGSFRFTYGSEQTELIAFDADAEDIQAALNEIEALQYVKVSGSIAAGLTVSMDGIYQPTALGTADNTLEDANPAATVITIAEEESAETLEEAINRSKSMVAYSGILPAFIQEEADLLASAALVQTLNKIAFAASNNAADVLPGGKLDLLRSGSLRKTRGLLYVGDGSIDDALLFSAAYAFRGMSTNFNGSNTTQTMHLKDLASIQPDSGLDETSFTNAKNAGADVYISIEGVPKTFTSGMNEFFDYVYNLMWFVGALQVAGFNFLAQTQTKVPQTDDGMLAFNSAYGEVCERAVTNQFLAPGKWTLPQTFGNQQDFFDNISQRGYFIYSIPVAQQSQAAREAREAPVSQIAIKTAGAFHSGDVIVNVNK